MAWQSSGYDPYKMFMLKSEQSRPAGLMGNINESSAFIALTAPGFFRKHWFWFIPFLIYGLYISKSFNGVIALGVISMFYAESLYPMAGILIFTLLYTISLFYFQRTDEAPGVPERLLVWKLALKGYAKNTTWIHGVGFGNWKMVYLKLAKAGQFPRGWMRLHNTFIESTIEMGIAFPVLVMAYIIQLWKRWDKSKLIPYLGILSAAVIMNTNSAFKMNFGNGLIIVFWLGYANRKDVKNGKV